MKDNKTGKTFEDIYFNTSTQKQDVTVLPNDKLGMPGAFNPKKGSKTKRGTFFPKKGDSIGEIIRKTVLIVSVFTMIICIGLILNMYIIQPFIASQKEKEIGGLTNNSVSPSDLSKLKETNPNIQLKYAGLYIKNNDFVGWLTIPGADISKPIVQVKGVPDESNPYLKKAFDKSKSKYGCCYISGTNNIVDLDRNTVIFGHNMSYDNLMFGNLEIYKNIKGFDAAPVIDFNTLNADHRWKIYAVFITNGKPSGEKNAYVFNYMFKNLSSDNAFEEYINQLDQRKLYTTGVDINQTDKILTLSTCCYDFDDAKLVVVARMVRAGESGEVDTSLAALNNNPRYPQAWYDSKGKVNPFKNASQWVPD